MCRGEFMNLKGLTIAHRGIHDKTIPENSLLAFQKCLEKNIPIELDVHLLKDGNIVVFHDFNTKRMTGVNKFIESMTLEEVKQLKLLKTSQKIPLLSEVLNLINSKVPLIIETKNYKVGPLEKALLNLLDSYSNFCIQSFSIKTVLWFRIHRPKYIVGLLISSKKKNKYNLWIPIHFISHSLLGIKNSGILKLRKKGIPIIVWNIQNEFDLVKAKEYGDSFIMNIKP